MNRILMTLFATAVGAVAIGVPVAAADDAQPPSRPGETARIVKKCIPALGFAAGVVTATDTDALVIDVQRTGKLGAMLVGQELTVDVVARTRFIKNAARAFFDDVEIDDRVAIRILKCRGERLVPDGMKAAIVTDFGPGAAGDAKVAAELTDDSQPDAALLAALGRPLLQSAPGLFQGQGQGQGQGAFQGQGQGQGAFQGQGQGQGAFQGQGQGQGSFQRRGDSFFPGQGQGAFQGQGQGAFQRRGDSLFPGQGQGQERGNGGGRGNAPGQAANG